MKRLLMILLDFIPTGLPISKESHENYITKLLSDYNLPDHSSYRQAVATAIMHLKPDIDAVPRRYFVKVVRKAMANDVAYKAIRRLVEEEKLYNERIEAEAEAEAQAKAAIEKAKNSTDKLVDKFIEDNRDLLNSLGT